MTASRGSHPTHLDSELGQLRAEITRLRAENTRLLRLLELTPELARPVGSSQTAIFEAAPGAVHSGSPPGAKVAFYAAMFAARTDAYAVRWENVRSGKFVWMLALAPPPPSPERVRAAGWRRGCMIVARVGSGTFLLAGGR